MIQILITGLFLLAQPSEPQDSLTVTQQGRTIATVNREDFTMPLPGTPMVDYEKYSKFIKHLDQKVYREPIIMEASSRAGLATNCINRRLWKSFMRIFMAKVPPR